MKSYLQLMDEYKETYRNDMTAVYDICQRNVRCVHLQ